MGRSILGAIAGYIVLSVVLFCLMAAAYLVLGAGGAFVEGAWDVTGTWIAASIVLGVGAAVVGGYVAKTIGRADTATWILMGVVVVLGLLTAVLQMGVEPTAGVRPDDVPLLEAMMKGSQPMWLTWLNPLLGVLGVWYGARLKSGAGDGEAV